MSGVKGALGAFGRDVGSQVLYNTTGLKFKGVFSGLLRSIRNKITRKAKPTVSVSAFAAGAGGSHSAEIRLRNGRHPALALDTLRSRLRQPVAIDPAGVARAGEGSAAPNEARGQAELRASVIEESLSERAEHFARGIDTLGHELDRMASHATFQQAVALRHELLDEIGQEFAQLRVLRREPESGLSPQAAQHAEQLLAAATLRILAPGSTDNAGIDALALDMAELSDKGVLSGVLLQAVAGRAGFWAAQADGAQASAQSDRQSSAAPEQDAKVSTYIRSYLSELADASRNAAQTASFHLPELKKKIGHSALYRSAEQALDKGAAAPMNDLRLRVHEEMVNELMQYADRHQELTLELKLLAAGTPQEREVVSLRHELEQVKKYLFELASSRGSGVDKASFRSMALDGVLLKIWKDHSVETKDINILIGQALALQTRLIALEETMSGQALSGRNVSIAFDDLRRVGLTEKSMGELRKSPAIVEDILLTAQSFAQKGMSGTRELRQFRQLSESAFKNVLNSSLVKRANVERHKLLPAERAQVLSVLLERQRPSDVAAIMQGEPVKDALDSLRMEGVANGQAGLLQSSSEHYQSIEENLSQELDRLLETVASEQKSVARLAALDTDARLSISPQDQVSIELAVNLREHLGLTEQRQQLRALEDKLADEIKRINENPGLTAPRTLTSLKEDLQAARDMLKALGQKIRQVDAKIVRAGGPLADRLWKYPDTESLSVAGKLSYDPALYQAVNALADCADARAQRKHSEQSIHQLSAGLDACLDKRKAAMGPEAARLLSDELRRAVAQSFMAMIRERELTGEPVEGATLLVSDYQEAILAELSGSGISMDTYGPELRHLLLREVSLQDIEQWLVDADKADKAGKADKTSQAQAARRTPEALAPEAEQVLATIAQLQPQERFFLSAGGGITGSTGGLGVVPGMYVGVSAGRGKDRLFEVYREGDEFVLHVADSTTLKAKFGVRAGLADGIVMVGASAAASATRGKGFEARYSSAQALADGMRQLYASRGADSQALLDRASSVSFISDAEKRVRAAAIATLDLMPLGEALAGIGAEQPEADADQQNHGGPFSLSAGAQAKAGAGVTWRDSTASNNQVQTVRHAKFYDIEFALDAMLWLNMPTSQAAVAEGLGVGDMRNVNEDAEDSEAFLAGIELGGKKLVRLQREKVVSELELTQSVRDGHAQSVACHFRFLAPEGMNMERLARVAPGYADQIRQMAPGAEESCARLFEQIDGSGFELTLTARLDPALQAKWNADYEAARAALERERPRLSVASCQREAAAIERRFARQLEAMTRDHRNMQVSGLALHKLESSDMGMAFNALVVKGNMAARAGSGELVNELKFLPPPASASQPAAGSDDLQRLLAESLSRRDELLSRLADTGRL
jgi:hypothetical protein